MEKASKEYRLEVAAPLARGEELQQTSLGRFDIKVKDAGWKSRKIKVELSGKHPRRPGGMFSYSPNRVAADIEFVMNMVARQKNFNYAFEFSAISEKTTVEAGQKGVKLLFVLEPH